MHAYPPKQTSRSPFKSRLTLRLWILLPIQASTRANTCERAVEGYHPVNFPTASPRSIVGIDGVHRLHYNLGVNMTRSGGGVGA